MASTVGGGGEWYSEAFSTEAFNAVVFRINGQNSVR